MKKQMLFCLAITSFLFSSVAIAVHRLDTDTAFGKKIVEQCVECRKDPAKCRLTMTPDQVNEWNGHYFSGILPVNDAGERWQFSSNTKTRIGECWMETTVGGKYSMRTMGIVAREGETMNLQITNK